MIPEISSIVGSYLGGVREIVSAGVSETARSLELPIPAALGLPENASLIVAGLLGVILAYWTVRRLTGSGADPTIRMSKSSETGSSSVLLSGTYAVGAIAALLTVAMWPVIESEPAAAAIPVAIVAAHWIIEKEETA